MSEWGEEEDVSEIPFGPHRILKKIKQTTVYPDLKNRAKSSSYYQSLKTVFHYYDPNWAKTSILSDAGIAFSGAGIGSLIGLYFTVTGLEEGFVLTDNYWKTLGAFILAFLLFVYTKYRSLKHVREAET